MKKLFGNTYFFKDKIKEMGGKWNGKEKCWYVPEAVYDELKELCKPRQMQGGEDAGYAPHPKSRLYECPDCGDDVWSGTSCWETGLTH